MPNLRYAHLIGRKFEEGGRGPETFDCRGLVLWVLGRKPPEGLGLRLPPGAVWWSASHTEAVALMAEYLTHAERSGWQAVSDGVRVGDVVLEHAPGKRPHLHVVVGTDPLIALGADVRGGVIAVPVRSITHVRAIYRWNPET